MPSSPCRVCELRTVSYGPTELAKPGQAILHAAFVYDGVVEEAAPMQFAWTRPTVHAWSAIMTNSGEFAYDTLLALCRWTTTGTPLSSRYASRLMM